jgi:hypothetical protein
MSRTTLLRRLKMLYAVIALGGALLLQTCGGHVAVYAQSVTADELQRRTEEKLTDRLEKEKSQLDEHLRSTDRQVNDLSNKVSVMQGVGTGVLGALGALQILGLVKEHKENHPNPRSVNDDNL